MTNKDFWLGFLCGVLFIVLLFILAPQPPTKRSKRQGIPPEQYAENTIPLGKVG